MFDTDYTDETGGSVAVLPAVTTAATRHPEFRGQRPPPQSLRRALATEPAVRVMTDFMRDLPFTVPADRLIDDALRDMMVAAVRALFVVRADRVVGLVTSYDIQGERPLQFLAASGFSRHDEIVVGHIMTPWVEVPKLDMTWVSGVQVAAVDRYFQRTFVSHAAVIERGDGGEEIIRGLFSRTRIDRQLARTSA
jgi:hypothetical protein